MQDNVLFNGGGALGTIQFGEGVGVVWHLMERGGAKIETCSEQPQASKNIKNSGFDDEVR